MARIVIGVGTTENDGTGDPLRTAFQSCNSNFTELYADKHASGSDAETSTTIINLGIDEIEYSLINAFKL